MADDLNVTPGTGATVAADDIGGKLHQRIKIRHGVDGEGVDASHADPFPVTRAKNLTAVVATVTASGDTTIHTPTAGKAIRLHYLYAMNDPDETTTPLIKVGFGPATSITKERYRSYGIAKERIFESAADDRLIVNLSGAGSVAITAHIEEFTP